MATLIPESFIFKSGDIPTGVNSRNQGSFSQARFGLDIIVSVGSVGCIVGLVIFKSQRRQALLFWNLIASLLCILVFEILTCAIEMKVMSYSRGTESDNQFFFASQILQSLFHHAAMCILFYIFYEMTHRCVEAATKGRALSRKVRMSHWALVGLVVVTALVDWPFWVTEILREVESDIGEGLALDQAVTRTGYIYADSLSQIVRWLISIEIVAWDIYTVVKAFTHSKKRGASVFLLCGSVFFFALNIMWAIFDINIYLAYGAISRVSTYAAVIAEAVLIIFIYAAILPFSMMWNSSPKAQRGEDLEKLNFPREPLEMEENAVKHSVPVEVPSNALVEASNGCDIVEADAKKTYVEADDSRQVVEADSRMLERIPSKHVYDQDPPAY